MFDTMKLTKAVGGVLVAFLFLLLGSWAANALFTIGGGGHGDAEEHAGMSDKPGGLLDEGDAGEEAEAADEPQIVLGTGDAAKGEKVFGKCKACHKVDGSNATGPHLDGVIDRAVAGVDGFAYSDAMAAHGGTWTLEALDAYLTNPKENIPGNKMSFAGLKKPEDRNDVIAYLQSLQ
ncbi:c-type cytochrome [Pseudothioclava nitratireducens]|jgi:cytochrome c|uniref:c-type cytochrome n=1 Tax=Pseudothioclava nitratireducens TaxID=1928646 RepID=UPI0023DBF53F|nr:cytochrome c family protein [Defluviimonas nitratireducens]MDF1619082.1 cytochrome c family protein [Defluviimonas nitratireducens]